MATLTQTGTNLIRALAESSREAFLLLDENAEVIIASRAASLTLGYSQDELAGNSLQKITSDPENQVSLPGAGGYMELKLRLGSGEERPTRWFVCKEDSAGGDVVYAAYLRQNVDLMDDLVTENFFGEGIRETILDHLPVGVLVTDKSGNIVVWNIAFEQIVGINRSEALGHNVLSEISGRLPEEVRDKFSEALESGVDNWELEFDIKSGEDRFKRLKTRIRTLKASRESIRGMIVTLEDLSHPHFLLKEARETGSFFNNLLDSSPNAIITTDNLGMINFYNRSAISILGVNTFNREEIPIADIFIGGQLEFSKFVSMLHQEGGKISHYETYLKHFDGHDLPVNITSSLLIDKEEQVEGILIIVMDLSLKKKLESDFRLHEHYLATVIRDSSEAIISLDSAGKIKTWNRGAENIFGYTSEEMIGEDLSRISPNNPSNTVELEWIESQLAQFGELRDYVAERVSADGHRLVLETTTTVLRDNSNNVSGRSIIYHDITERARLQERLQQHVFDLSLINEISEVLLTTTELNEVLGIILCAVTASQGLGFNRAFLLLIEDSDNELVGQMAIGPSNAEEAGIIWSELFHQHLSLRELLTSYKSRINERDIHVNEIVRKFHIPLDDRENPLVRCLRLKLPMNISGGVASGEIPEWLAELLGTDSLAIVPMVCKHRSIGLLIADNLINRQPIQDNSVRLLKVFANLASQAIEKSRLYMSLEEKIDDLDRAYKELKDNRTRLVRAERLSAIGEVSAKMAHEIRNPLVSIGGFTRSLKNDMDETDRRWMKVKIIIEEVERLERFLEDTLNFVRPRFPNFKKIDPAELIRETAAMMNEELEGAEVEFSLDNQAGNLTIDLDPEQIRQVFINLFRNAIEAMPEGGNIKITSYVGKDTYRISIADTGVGIAGKDIEKIFTAFFTTKSMGSGLGLTISSQIVENHGGTITIRSRSGEGTVFDLYLPLVQVTRQEEEGE